MPHPRRFEACFVVVPITLWAINNYFVGSALMDLLQMFSCFPISWFFAEKRARGKAVAYMMAFQFTGITINYLVGLVAFPIGERLGFSAAYLISKYGYGNAVMCFLCAGTLPPTLPLVLRLMDWLWDNPKKLRTILLFASVPLSQAVSLNLLNRYIAQSGETVGFSVPLCIAAVFSIAADVCAIVSIRKLQSVAQTEARLQNAEQQLNVQTDYYRQLQENILSVNQIRHDLNNQLTAAYRLLEAGQDEAVRQQLDLLRSSIREKVGPRYCGNLIVDAVLDEKARKCRETGIRLSLDAQLPPSLPIENAHLCSAFSNLLDNSIQGALDSGAAEKNIELRTTVQKDCLVIRCRNTAAAPEKKDRSDPLRSHGLGLGILSRLAETYGGSFQTSYENSTFSAVLILCFPQN